MIRIACPSCQKKLGVDDALAGRVAACPQCKSKFRVPQPRVAPAAEAAEERVSTARAVRPPSGITPARRVEGEPQTPVRRARPVEDDEIEIEVEEEGAVRPAGRSADDESAEDDEAPRRPRRKKKKRRKKSTAAWESFNLPMALIGVGSICLLCALLAIWIPILAFVPIGVGYVTMLAGGIWFLVVAFQDSPLHGILCLFCGLYQLFYLITHLEEEKVPFGVSMIGFVLVLAGMGGAALGAH